MLNLFIRVMALDCSHFMYAKFCIEVLCNLSPERVDTSTANNKERNNNRNLASDASGLVELLTSKFKR